MSADGVEIAENDSGKIWICDTVILDDFLVHIFGAAVGARNIDAGLHGFSIGGRILFAIDSSRGTEDEFLYIRFPHGFKEINSADEICFVIS